jgi:hypothetical protein
MRYFVLLFAGFVLAGCGGGGSSSSPPPPPPPPPTNNAPVASDVAALIRPAETASGTLAATDADGDALTYALAGMPANGMVSLSGTGDEDFVYTPNGGFAGVDTFTFNASDGTDTSNTATVTITVNTPPTLGAASYTTSDIGTASGIITGSDTDGDTLTFALSTPPTKGTITSFDPATGEFVYTPDPAEDGADSFQVTASDAAETSAPGTISVEIFDWVGTQQFGSGALDSMITKGLAVLPDGSQLQVGVTEGQVASTPPGGDTDVFVRRTDRRGNETSIRQFGGAGPDAPRSLLVRPQGDGYYIAVSSDADSLYRFDGNDNELYSVPITAPAGYNLVQSAYWAGVDSSGDVYVLAWIQVSSAVNPPSGMVTKFNGADGAVLWQRLLESSADDAVDFFIADTNRISPRGIDFDSGGDPVVVGEYWDTSGTRPCQRCGFIAKLNADTGNDIWVREPDAFANCGADGSGRLYRVTVGGNDTLYVNGLANFSGFPGTDGLVAKYSGDGLSELWRFCDNSGADTTSYFTEPLLTSDAGLINYGFVGDANSPPDPGNGGPSASELVVYKFDLDGNILWTRRIPATKADASAAFMSAGSVAEDSQGILYVTGGSDGELTAAPNSGDLDAIVIRLAPDGTVQ